MMYGIGEGSHRGDRKPLEVKNNFYDKQTMPQVHELRGQKVHKCFIKDTETQKSVI